MNLVMAVVVYGSLAVYLAFFIWCWYLALGKDGDKDANRN